MHAGRELRVEITPDASEAAIIAPPDADPAVLNAGVLALLVQQAGVAMDASVKSALDGFLSEYGDGERGLRFVIARAVPPVPGENARVDWADGIDPRGPHKETHLEGGRTDHFAGMCYSHVKAGSVLGTLHESTPGTDGRDVRGLAIAAAPGDRIKLRFQPTITVDSAGRISAQADGELMLVGDEAWISNDLVIPGNVDFSVGRVAFTGNVTINGGVRSGFSVKCGGDLHIGGLVEVADIDCHGSLNSRGGIAGDGRATLAVGGRTHIVYLDGVHGRVGGDLEVERELVNCRLVIGGALSCAAATIMGGEIAVTGSLLVKSLGSDSGSGTAIHLGDAPLIGTDRATVAREAAALTSKLAKIAEQERQLELSPRKSAADRERLTELNFEASQLDAELKKRQARLAEIELARQTLRKVDVHVSKVIHAGVVLLIGAQRISFTEDLKGPLSIGWDEQHNVVYRFGQGVARPITEVARVSQAAPPDRHAHNAAA